MKVSRRFVLTLGVAAAAMELGGCRRVIAQVNDWLKRLTPPGSASDPVLARVGQSSVTRSDLLHYLQAMPPDFRAGAQSAQGRLSALQVLANQAALTELAQQAGLERDPGYQQSLKNYRDGLLSSLYMDRIRAEVSVSSAEVRAYYDAHPQEFIEGTIHASRIVTKSYAQARKAQDLLGAGKPFAEVAQALSIDDATAKDSGRIPPARTGQVDPILEETVRHLHKGQVSWIINKGAEYELIRKDDDIQGAPKPYQSVEAALAFQLQDLKMYKRREDAKSKLHIVIDEKKLKELDSSSW